MAEQTNAPATSAKDVLVIERVFDAPRELVWKAWTDPEMYAKWWGPRGFTGTVRELDVRVGGRFLGAMTSPDFNEGRPIWSTGVYQEVIPLERIVSTDSFADENGNVVSPSEYGMPDDFPREMRVIVTLQDSGDGKTKLTLRHEGMPAGMQTDAGSGWNESFDKMAEALAS
jgi:uncharacterized protein YndB with AHSA1/START domain